MSLPQRPRTPQLSNQQQLCTVSVAVVPHVAVELGVRDEQSPTDPQVHTRLDVVDGVALTIHASDWQRPASNVDWLALLADAAEADMEVDGAEEGASHMAGGGEHDDEEEGQEEEGQRPHAAGRKRTRQCRRSTARSQPVEESQEEEDEEEEGEEAAERAQAKKRARHSLGPHHRWLLGEPILDPVASFGDRVVSAEAHLSALLVEDRDVFVAALQGLCARAHIPLSSLVADVSATGRPQRAPGRLAQDVLTRGGSGGTVRTSTRGPATHAQQPHLPPHLLPAAKREVGASGARGGGVGAAGGRPPAALVSATAFAAGRAAGATQQQAAKRPASRAAQATSSDDEVQIIDPPPKAARTSEQKPQQHVGPKPAFPARGAPTVPRPPTVKPGAGSGSNQQGAAGAAAAGAQKAGGSTGSNPQQQQAQGKLPAGAPAQALAALQALAAQQGLPLHAAIAAIQAAQASGKDLTIAQLLANAANAQGGGAGAAQPQAAAAKAAKTAPDASPSQQKVELVAQAKSTGPGHHHSPVKPGPADMFVAPGRTLTTAVAGAAAAAKPASEGQSKVQAQGQAQAQAQAPAAAAMPPLPIPTIRPASPAPAASPAAGASAPTTAAAATGNTAATAAAAPPAPVGLLPRITGPVQPVARSPSPAALQLPTRQPPAAPAPAPTASQQAPQAAPSQATAAASPRTVPAAGSMPVQPLARSTGATAAAVAAVPGTTVASGLQPQMQQQAKAEGVPVGLSPRVTSSTPTAAPQLMSAPATVGSQVLSGPSTAIPQGSLITGQSTGAQPLLQAPAAAPQFIRPPWPMGMPQLPANVPMPMPIPIFTPAMPQAPMMAPATGMPIAGMPPLPFAAGAGQAIFMAQYQQEKAERLKAQMQAKPGAQPQPGQPGAPR